MPADPCEQAAPQRGARRGRTQDEIRADVFGELLLATPDNTDSAAANVRAQVQVIITDEALIAEQLRLDDDRLYWGAPSPLFPAELVSSGPIDTKSARRLAASTSHWELLKTHSETGGVLSVERYRPSEQMRRILRARDIHCLFLGCRAPVYRCDIDHTIDAAQ